MPGWRHGNQILSATRERKTTVRLAVAIGPVVVEAMTNFLIDGAHRLHVGFAPLTAQIFGLHLQQLQHVQLQQSVLDLQGPLQDRRRFKDDQHLQTKRTIHTSA